MILRKIRKSQFSRVLSIVMAWTLLAGQIIWFPGDVKALGGGPTAPEATGFSGTKPQRHVNMFTGDFQYGISLFEIGGYPFALNYSSNINMEQEAGWVGWGWDLNTGSVSRNMRGLPDDFNEKTITEEVYSRPNYTIGLGFGLSAELLTKELSDSSNKTNIGLGLNFYYNNYKGLFTTTSYSWGSGILNLGISTGPNGVNLSVNFNLEKELNDKSIFGSGSLGLNINSRKGIESLNFGYDLVKKFQENSENKNQNKKQKKNEFLRSSFSIPSSELNYSPGGILRYQNLSFGLRLKLTGTFNFNDIPVSPDVNATFQKQSLTSNIYHTASYGYFYRRHKNNKEAYYDFNREKDNGFIPGKEFLPLTYTTPDFFSVSAGGVNGTFRAYYYEPFVAFDPEVKANASKSYDVGLEIGVGNQFESGGNGNFMYVRSRSGKWEKQNGLSLYGMVPSVLYENLYGLDFCYFRDISEPLPGVDNDHLQNIGGEQAVAFPLDITNGQFNYYLKPNPVRGNNTYTNWKKPKPFEAALKGTKVFHPLTKKNIQLHPWYDKVWKDQSAQVIGSLDDFQLAGVKVRDENGRIYYFNLPAINYEQKEVSFSVDPPSNDFKKILSTKFIKYSDQDCSPENKKGVSHTYRTKTIPAYAYAFLITDVLSPDYVDVGNDGPTPDDYGEYVHFSYERLPQYRWRLPMTKNTHWASYNPGLAADRGDDMAFYTYGTKDVYYVKEVRSKDKVAIFYTSPRNDGFQAAGEKGGLDGSVRLRKLDSIKVFHIAEYRQMQANARPLTRVVFEYDYSLCKNVWNANGISGKLTLKKVSIYRGEENKHVPEVYTFEYSQFNPDYSPLHVDGWGEYQPPIVDNAGDTFPALLHPFVHQTANHDLYATAWRLTRINLPQGGSIMIEYESDRYALVEDEPVRKLYRLLDIKEDTTQAPNSYKLSPVQIDKDDNILFFETTIPVSEPYHSANGIFKKMMANSGANIYFKALMKFTKNDNINDDFDYVLGMARILNYGLKTSSINGHYIGWVKVENEQRGLANYHPFTYSAIMSGLTTHNHVVQQDFYINHDDFDNPGKVLKMLLNKILSNITNFLEFFKGPVKSLHTKGVGKKVVPGYSFIRLCLPEDKYGGGSRVKKIIYHNSWNQMTSQGELPITLIKTYRYEFENGKTSGVAAYEPQTIGDEIPHHTIMHYTDQTPAPLGVRIFPSPEYRNIGPPGEMMYPSPSVGYARVVEKTEVPSIFQNLPADGRVEEEYYTAADDPVKVDYTPLIYHHARIKSPKIFAGVSKDHQALSQGFSVVLNNRHGLIKREIHYDNDGVPLRQVVHHYTNANIPYLKKDMTIEQRLPGIETDITVDLREQQTISESFEKQVNFNASYVGILLPILSMIPTYAYSENIFRSATITKVIQKSYVETRQTIIEKGANVSMENLLWDPMTGSPLASRVRNEWGKYQYTFSLPARLVYPGMGEANGKEGRKITIETAAGGKVIQGNTQIGHGDVILVVKNLQGAQYNLQTAKIYHIFKHQNGEAYLIDENGNGLAGVSAECYVWHSGNNHLLGAKVQEISSINSPIQNNMITFSNLKVLSAKANTYTDFYSYPHNGCLYECDTSVQTTFKLKIGSNYVLENQTTKGSPRLFPLHGQNDYLALSLVNANGTDTIVLTRFDSNHQPKWQKKIGLSDFDNITASYLDSLNRLFIAGKLSVYFSSTNKVSYLFLMVVDQHGQVNDSKIFYDNKFDFEIYDIKLVGDSIYLCGNMVYENTVKPLWMIVNFDNAKLGNGQAYYYPLHAPFVQAGFERMLINGLGVYFFGTAISNDSLYAINILMNHQAQLKWAKSFFLKLLNTGNPASLRTNPVVYKDKIHTYTGREPVWFEFEGEKLPVWYVSNFESAADYDFMSILMDPYTGQFLEVKKHYVSSCNEENMPYFITSIYQDRGNQHLLMGIHQRSKNSAYFLKGNPKTGFDEGNLLMVEGTPLHGFIKRVAPLLNIDMTSLSKVKDNSNDPANQAMKKNISGPVGNAADLYNQNSGYEYVFGFQKGNGFVANDQSRFLLYSRQSTNCVIPLIVKDQNTSVEQFGWSLSFAEFISDTSSLPKAVNPMQWAFDTVCKPDEIEAEILATCDCGGFIRLKNYNPDYIYEWSTGEQGTSIGHLCPGNYRLNIKMGCHTLASAEVSLIELLGKNKFNALLMNPFRHNLSGCWRPFEEFLYESQIKPAPNQPIDSVPPHERGVYTSFNPFWTYQNGWWKQNNNQWVLKERITHYAASGVPIESRDVQFNYTSSAYGFAGKYMDYQIFMARSNEAGFDSFEDYYPEIMGNFRLKSQQQAHTHFRFVNDSLRITWKFAHTGNHSVEIPSMQHIALSGRIKEPLPDSNFAANSGFPFYLTPYHCSDVFAPFAGKQKYLISFWVYEPKNKSKLGPYAKGPMGAGVVSNANAIGAKKSGKLLPGNPIEVQADPKIDMYNVQPEFYINGQKINVKQEYRSELMDDWRLYVYHFEWNANVCDVWELRLANYGLMTAYVDDLRIHPYRALMKTNVFYPFSGSLAGQADENNLPVWYQYNEKGELQENVRVTGKNKVFMQYRLKTIQTQ